MASKFGGIPVRKESVQEPSGSKFGGVRVKSKQEVLPKEEEEERGIADFLLEKFTDPVAPLETVGMLATGAVAEPISGLAGIAGTVLPGPEGQGAEWVERTQRALTYAPRTERGRQYAQDVAEVLIPITSAAESVSEYVGEKGFEAGGPLGGAAYKTALAAIPEILGLKGTRAAKKGLIKKIVKQEENISELYDELGNLMPEIKKGIEDSGISMDELRDVLPETSDVADVTKQAERMEEAAGQIGEAATSRIGAKGKIEGIAEEVKPSAEILEAADEFGVSDQLLASHTSQNPTFVAVEQGLKSIPGSQLATQEKALIADLAQKADDLIVEFGGEIDKSSLSDRFRSESGDLIRDLEKQAESAYSKVAEEMDPSMPVSANSTLDMIGAKASELGGIEYLDPKEAMLLKNLDPGSNPTYARLDRLRKQIGSALNKNTGPFKDADSGALKQLYKSLSEDQQIAAEAVGAGDLYETAKDLVVSRKTIEKQLEKAIGKDLTGSISAKARPAMLGLQKGDAKQFDDLLKNIPEDLGPELKRTVVSTALNDAFVQGSRADRSLNIAGFDDFMKGINRHVASKNKLKNVIGDESMRRLETFHTVVSGIRKAQKDAITTGRIQAVPGMFDEVQSIASRLYGTGKKIAAAEGVSSAIGVPGAGTAGVLGSVLSAKKTPRSVAADQLLASPKFKQLLRQKASGKLDTDTKLKRAEKIVENMKAYKEWEKSLDKASLSDLATVGAIGYLTGEPTEDRGEQ